MVLPVAASVVACAAAPAGAPTPADVLASRGLAAAGAYFVLAAEGEILDAIRRLAPYGSEVRSTSEEYAGARQAQRDYLAAVDERAGVVAQIGGVESEIASTPISSRRALAVQLEQLKARRKVVEANIKSLGARRSTPSRVDALFNQYRARNRAYYAESAKVAPAYADLKATYAGLAKDEEVGLALKAIGRPPRAKVQLGPSKALADAVASIRAFEKAFPPVDPGAGVGPGQAPARKSGSSKKR